MKRIITLAAGIVVVLAMMAAPAAAHVLAVDPPGAGEPADGWVGGPPLPGQGTGLIPGGPGGDDLQAPSHAQGLNTACDALRAHGRAAVDIFGPGGPGCPHGG